VDGVKAAIQAQVDKIHSVKLALLSSGRVPVRDLFPELIASATNEDIDKALEEDLPLEVTTDVTPKDALAVLEQLAASGNVVTGDDVTAFDPMDV
jgi:hypothetical protein